jgi:hypothetical protein
MRSIFPADNTGLGFRSRRVTTALVVSTLFFICAMLSCAAVANASVDVFNAADPGATPPPSKEQNSHEFLVINLNPMKSEAIAVNKTVTNTQSSSSNAPTPAKTLSSGSDSSVPQCAASPNPVTCKQAASDLEQDLTNLQKPFLGQSSATLTANTAALLETQLASISTSSIATSTDFSTAIRTYSAAVAAIQPGPISAKLTPLGASNMTLLLQKYNQDYSTIQDASQKVPNNGEILADQKFSKQILDTLTGTSILAIENTADSLNNQLTQMAVDQTPFYSLVDARCEKLGFNADSYTLKFNRGTATVWEDDVTCFPEFSVGAMYYLDWLNTTTYTLNGNRPVAQSNNRNQGSVAAVFNWCPFEGGTTGCGTVAASSGTNGLDAYLGGAILFAHRALGVNGGIHVGQVNVLTNGYTTNTIVPSGAVYQRKSTAVAGYVGLTLNTGSK